MRPIAMAVGVTLVLCQTASAAPNEATEISPADAWEDLGPQVRRSRIYSQTVGRDSTGREVYFRARLFDHSSDTVVFESLQASSSTPNESFVLGLTEGDTSSTSTGSLAGTLLGTGTTRSNTRRSSSRPCPDPLHRVRQLPATCPFPSFLGRQVWRCSVQVPWSGTFRSIHVMRRSHDSASSLTLWWPFSSICTSSLVLTWYSRGVCIK